VVAAVIVLAVALAGAMAFVWRANSRQSDATAALVDCRDRLASLHATYLNRLSDLKECRRQHESYRARAERVIGDLKNEIEATEAILANLENPPPEIVMGRLRRAIKTARDHRNQGTAGAMPAG
jgi:hypothetical protein